MKLPKFICHSFSLHKWKFLSFNFLSGECQRCGMGGNEFWQREKRSRKPTTKSQRGKS